MEEATLKEIERLKKELDFEKRKTPKDTRNFKTLQHWLKI